MYGMCVFCLCISALFLHDQIYPHVLLQFNTYRIVQAVGTVKPHKRMAEKLRHSLQSGSSYQVYTLLTLHMLSTVQTEYHHKEHVVKVNFVNKDIALWYSSLEPYFYVF